MLRLQPVENFGAAYMFPPSVGYVNLARGIPEALTFLGRRFERTWFYTRPEGAIASYREDCCANSAHGYLFADGRLIIDHVDSVRPHAAKCGPGSLIDHDVKDNDGSVTTALGILATLGVIGLVAAVAVGRQK